jgi:hypothetical protein
MQHMQLLAKTWCYQRPTKQSAHLFSSSRGLVSSTIAAAGPWLFVLVSKVQCSRARVRSVSDQHPAAEQVTGVNEWYLSFLILVWVNMLVLWLARCGMCDGAHVTHATLKAHTFVLQLDSCTQTHMHKDS